MKKQGKKEIWNVGVAGDGWVWLEEREMVENSVLRVYDKPMFLI